MELKLLCRNEIYKDECEYCIMEKGKIGQTPFHLIKFDFLECYFFDKLTELFSV